MPLTQAPLPELMVQVEIVSAQDKSLLVEMVLVLIERIREAEVVLLKHGALEADRLQQAEQLLECKDYCGRYDSRNPPCEVCEYRKKFNPEREDD
jgi:hypothetical protein